MVAAMRDSVRHFLAKLALEPDMPVLKGLGCKRQSVKEKATSSAAFSLRDM